MEVVSVMKSRDHQENGLLLLLPRKIIKSPKALNKCQLYIGCFFVCIEMLLPYVLT
jgi:hypothetical protein